jgi:acylphosphatase
MSKIPGFRVESSNGTVSVIFQTTDSNCIMKFENKLLTITVNSTQVFQAGLS